MTKRDEFKEFLQDRYRTIYTGYNVRLMGSADTWLKYLTVDEWLNYGNMFAVLQEKKMLKKRIAELEQKGE